MKAITFDGLKREIGDEHQARDLYLRIARLGGFGTDLDSFEGGYPPLDVSGLSEAKQQSITQMVDSVAAKTEEAETPEKKTKKEGGK